MRPSFLACLVSCAVLGHLANGPAVFVRAELHHQRHLPRPSAGSDPGEELSLHAKASRSTFAVGDHLLTWLADHPAQHRIRRRGAELTAEDVVFIVMVRLRAWQHRLNPLWSRKHRLCRYPPMQASDALKDRVATQKASWMRWAQHVVAFSDAADPGLGIITLPEIQNKTGFAEAQTRQLHGMKWIYNNRADLASKKWFFCVDDDTWVNVPSLLEYISRFPETLPLSFSHMYLRYNAAVYNGGAGMLFSREAFRRIAAALFTDECPLSELPPAPLNNDNILAECAYSTGVLKVTSSKFGSYGGTEFITPTDDAGWLDQITMHRVTDRSLAELMWCWSERLHGQAVAEPCQAMAEDENWDR